MGSSFTTIFNGVVPRITRPIPLERAVEIFDQLADMEDIAFGYTYDGCYARAHIMCRRLEAMGLTPEKAWAFEGTSMLKVTIAGETTRWSWHVAPTLAVQTPDGKVQDLVMDPSLFDGPVSLAEWGAIMQAKAHRLQITPFGVAPDGLSGDYDTENRTAPQTDGWASNTMKEYMALQNSEPRKVFPSQSRQQVGQSQAQGKTWVTHNIVAIAMPPKKPWYKFGM